MPGERLVIKVCHRAMSKRRLHEDEPVSDLVSPSSQASTQRRREKPEDCNLSSPIIPTPLPYRCGRSKRVQPHGGCFRHGLYLLLPCLLPVLSRAVGPVRVVLGQLLRHGVRVRVGVRMGVRVVMGVRLSEGGDGVRVGVRLSVRVRVGF